MSKDTASNDEKKTTPTQGKIVVESVGSSGVVEMQRFDSVQEAIDYAERTRGEK